MNLLEDFLLNFEGCLLVVSHDRWFMNKLVDHIFVSEGGGKVKDFYGNYSEYKASELQLEKGRQMLAKAEKRPVEPRPAKRENVNKLTYKEKKEMERLEEEIAALEEEKKGLDNLFANPEGAAEKLAEASVRYQEVQRLLDDYSMRWLELSEKEG